MPQMRAVYRSTFLRQLGLPRKFLAGLPIRKPRRLSAWSSFRTRRVGAPA